MKRIIFLFNHDAPHQVAHLAGVAAAFARQEPSAKGLIAYSSSAIRAQIERLIDANDRDALEWVELELGRFKRALGRLLDSVVPASRLMKLDANLALFANADAIVSTERTCLRIQKRLGNGGHPLFIRLPHGAGDRNVTFHPDNARFDKILVPGRKAVEQLSAHGVPREKIEIVGYPKFDAVADRPREKFFDNDRPSFVYNPHFDPNLSSWYDLGPALLSWFASDEGQAFNCIFAPHVMLFRKAVHVSPEYRIGRRRPDIPAEAFAAPNILIDTESPRLFDMSYTLSADGYIGDASSQIYEFLIEPRAVFFLDRRRIRLAEDEQWMAQWQAGPKFSSVDELARALPEFHQIAQQYRSAQQRLFSYSFDRQDTPANERAAKAIARLVGDRG